MTLSESTVAGLCAFLAAAMWIVPMPVLDAEHKDFQQGTVDWVCPMPLRSLGSPDVDLQALRRQVVEAQAEAAASAAGYRAPQSRHPQCRSLAWTQAVLGLLAAAGAAWKGRRWWRASADARAEKKFLRLHEAASGRSGRKSR